MAASGDGRGSATPTCNLDGGVRSSISPPGRCAMMVWRTVGTASSPGTRTRAISLPLCVGRGTCRRSSGLGHLCRRYALPARNLGHSQSVAKSERPFQKSLSSYRKTSFGIHPGQSRDGRHTIDGFPLLSKPDIHATCTIPTRLSRGQIEAIRRRTRRCLFASDVAHAVAHTPGRFARKRRQWSASPTSLKWSISALHRAHRDIIPASRRARRRRAARAAFLARCCHDAAIPRVGL